LRRQSIFAKDVLSTIARPGRRNRRTAPGPDRSAMSDSQRIAADLPCWSGPVAPLRLPGGISNDNYLVADQDRKFVVRVNGDVPQHGILRSNDATCNRAAAAAGVAPAVFHAGPNAVVVDFVEGRTLAEEDVRGQEMLDRILPLIKRTHNEAFRLLRGPVCAFWPFRVCRDYAFFLEENGSRKVSELPRLRAANEKLEGIVGPVTPVLGHNDLLAANFIDDGKKVWLIDWEHGGITSALFDLANLATNNTLSAGQEAWLLETYYERSPDEAMRRRFQAMKSASLLRETMWSMVSELGSTVAFDYVAYTHDYIARFDAEYERF
jgi:thiamine kinase-like enzyme